MKRSVFLAVAASAIPMSRLSRPSPARAEAPSWRGPMRYCGSAVVWLNTANGIYYYKGDRWYGRTKRGAYACEKEAINAGNRA